MRHGQLGVLLLLATGTALAAGTSPRTLSFEERVQAQEAIERVYYSHQTGATLTFEKAVPPVVLETKVRTYLKQSVALDRLWKTPITSVMLQHERERMEKSTRMPGRLRELYAALHDDSFLIEECLVRATLVDRLTRNFFAYDERYQGDARSRAGELQAQIVSGAVDPLAEHPRRTLIVGVNDRTGGHAADPRESEDVAKFTRDRIEERIPSDRFGRWADDVAGNAESRGKVTEDTDSFRIKVLLDRDSERISVAVFRIDKRSWNDWWDATKASLDELSVTSVAFGVADSTFDLGSGDCPVDDTWDAGSLSAIPDTNRDFTAVWTGTEMIVWGDSGTWGWGIATAGRYDPETDTWAAAPTGIPGRQRHTAVWTGSQMIIWGGWDNGEFDPVGGRYDPATNSWAPMSTVNEPGIRMFHTAVWTGSAMVVWGGRTEGVEGIVNTGARYDPLADTWSPTSTTNAPSAREEHTAVWTGTEMIVWGGRESSTNSSVDTGGRYNPATDTWSATSALNAPAGREHHSAVWCGNVMVVWGGSGGDLLDTGGRYDPTTDTWSATSTMSAPSPRWEHTAVWTGAEMIAWGGVGDASGPNQGLLVTGGRYDPASNKWAATSTLNAISDSPHQAGVWTGDHMLVWRGRRGARYDPGSDTWTPIASAPAQRQNHAAVWTGNEMIVWGGDASGNSGMNSGGRYNPTTDAWTLMSTGANTPDGRVRPKAIWTGTEMIVWGGGTYTAMSNTGGRYNPISDTWLSISIQNAPSAREHHTLVWSGTEMIAWGGDGGPPNNAVETGGRYNPATDVWTSTSVAGAPSARSGHFAVWTGNRMVVWGGWAGDVLRTGGQYDPVNDTWTPTSAAPEPGLHREAERAVWTGTEWILLGDSFCYRYDPAADHWIVAARPPDVVYYGTFVWAGSRAVLWDGAINWHRFNLVTNTWTPTSHVGEPIQRRRHSAVWTGTEMIVWGGSTSSHFDLGDGSRYAVTPDDDGDGFTACTGDCNDLNTAVHPGAIESCNAVDDNCNGQTDEDATGLDTDIDGIHNACDNCRSAYNPTQLESDGDGVGNACDNCALVANPSQADLDSDARGDVCDNCPAASNPFQDDFDGDRAGDACDNCVFDWNATQSDFDHDNQGDLCDLNDGLIYVYSTDKNYREWQAETGYTTWNSYRGSLAVLRATGQYTQAPGSNALAARDCGLSDAYVFDPLVPAPGELAFNLVTGVAGGVESSLGTNSAGVPRANANPCP